jgi:hypothetical protein
MKFAVITPSRQETIITDFSDLNTALRAADLHFRGVDHGMLAIGVHRVGIIVYEFSLFVPAAEQSYFAIHGHLYAGNAVLYGVDDNGSTVDLRVMPEVFFMPNQHAVERSISLGLITRPYMAVNKQITWQWPQPHKIPK